MKRFFLSAALVAAVASPVLAEWHSYTPTWEGERVLGVVSGISQNGQYATIYDEENELSYLWNLDNPSELVMLNSVIGEYEGSIKFNKIQANDVTNDGTIVGCIYEAEGSYLPAYYKNGEWVVLPISEFAINTKFVRRTSADGSVMAGVQMVVDKELETGSGYRACRWTRNDDGEYDLETFITLPDELAGHQGFYTYDMSENGSIILGMTMIGNTQATTPTYVENGDYWGMNSCEYRLEPWYYKGEIMGYDYNAYIDGLIDSDSDKNVQGYFAFYNNQNNCAYGMYTKVSDVSEDGQSGKMTLGACIYNFETGELTQDTGYSQYIMAHNDVIYAYNKSNNFRIIKDGKGMTFNEYFGFNPGVNLTALSEMSASAHVLGGMHEIFNEAKQYPDYFPFIMVDDQAGADEMAAAPAAEIAVANGMISVNEGTVAVFDMQGRLMGNAAAVAVAPGLYIAKTADTVRKVGVK